MTTKQRNKNTTEGNSDLNQDDVAKKATSREGDAPARRSGSWVKVLAAVCYVTLFVTAVFAAFYLRGVLQEFGKISSSTDGSIQKNAEMSRRMESVFQQVDSLREKVEGFGSAIGGMQAELGGVGQALRRGEAEVRQADEVLRTLRDGLLLDLSHGVQEVREAHGRDSSALEERLTELARSVGGSMARLTGAQSKMRGQLGDIRHRLEAMPDTAPLREGLLDVAAAVEKFRAASQLADATTKALRDRVTAAGAELQDRNQKMAATVQEMETVKLLSQSTAEVLGQSMSAVDASIQALSDQVLSLQTGLDQASGSIPILEEGLREAAVRAETSKEEAETRLSAVEKNIDVLQASKAEREAGLESLLSRSESQESTLAALAQDLQSTWSGDGADDGGLQAALRDAEQAGHTVSRQVEEVKNELGELLRAVDVLSHVQKEQALWNSSLSQQLEGLGQRLEELGKAIGEAQASNQLKVSIGHAGKDLQQLRSSMDGIESFFKKVEGHVETITVLMSTLEDAKASIGTMCNEQN